MTKNYITRSLVLLLFVAAAACNNAKKDGTAEGADMSNFKEAKINNQYSMMIPNYMTETHELNEAASLQYQNPVKETYVVVIDEVKSEFIEQAKEVNAIDSTLPLLKNFMKAKLDYLKDGFTVASESQPKSSQVNGLKAETIEIEGKSQDIAYDIYYHITCLESKDKLYTVLQWTMPKDKDTYKADFEAAVRSFKELGGGSAGAPASK